MSTSLNLLIPSFMSTMAILEFQPHFLQSNIFLFSGSLPNNASAQCPEILTWILNLITWKSILKLTNSYLTLGSTPLIQHTPNPVLCIFFSS